MDGSSGIAALPGGHDQVTGPAATTGGPDSLVITVNRKENEAPRPCMTAKEIKAMARAPPHHTLILVGSPDGGPGDGDRPEPDNAAIQLKRGMRFRTVNKAEFGARPAARISTPPACAAAFLPAPGGW